MRSLKEIEADIQSTCIERSKIIDKLNELDNEWGRFRLSQLGIEPGKTIVEWSSWTEVRQLGVVSGLYILKDYSQKPMLELHPLKEDGTPARVKKTASDWTIVGEYEGTE